MENLQLRTEHSRSLEDAGKYQALQALTELGFLIPLAETDSFHGRVADTAHEDAWTVDPTIKNGKGDNRNDNINPRTTLYTSDQETADAFAEARLVQIPNQGMRDHVREQMMHEDPATFKKKRFEVAKAIYDARPEHQRKYFKPPAITEEVQAADLSPMRLMDAINDRIEVMPEDEAKKLRDSLSRDLKAEVHEIASDDTDASVINFGFDIAKLSDDDKAKFQTATQTLIQGIKLTEGSPLDFEDKDNITPLMDAMKGGSFITSEKAVAAANQIGTPEDPALQLAGSYNAYQLSATSPGYLAGLLLDNKDDLTTQDITVNGEKVSLPINLEFVQKFFRNNHIVGVRHSVNSDTLNKSIYSTSLFDLERINSTERLAAERAETVRHLGAMASKFEGSLAETGQYPSKLIALINENPHAKAEQLIEATKALDGFAEIFDADAGNWEGFTLGEHTETVLRNFDENFADKVPVELIGPMRLALVAHDAGKPIARKEGQGDREKEYNDTYAADLLSKAGVDEKTSDFLRSIIGQGMRLAFDVNVRNAGQEKVDELRTLAKTEIQKLWGVEDVSSELIDSYVDFCKIIQICDGGAYTSMATTRREGKGTFRNAPSFNSSFAEPAGFGKRGLKLVQPGQRSASKSHFSRPSQEPKSRVKISSGHNSAKRTPSFGA